MFSTIGYSFTQFFFLVLKLCFEIRQQQETMKSRFKNGILLICGLFLFGIVPLVNVVDGQTACNMLTGNNYVFPQVDFPTTSFIYECQNTTLYMGQANISFYGYQSDGSLISLDQWANGATTTITVTPNTGLIWETAVNTCTNLNAALPTNATCQCKITKISLFFLHLFKNLSPCFINRCSTST